MPEDEIVEKHGKKPFTTDKFLEETASAFDDMIDMCLQRDIRVIIAVVPVSDNYIWEYSDLDVFVDWVRTRFCGKDVEFYDFNLIKNRYEVLSDADCYGSDPHHMSGKGAKAFSAEFSKIVKLAAEGEDVSPLFYGSYADMINDSPYMEYYRSHG